MQGESDPKYCFSLFVSHYSLHSWQYKWGIRVPILKTFVEGSIHEYFVIVKFRYPPITNPVSTVDAFIFVGTNFRGLNKNNTRVGFKFVAIIFSFIIHTQNRYFVGTRIRGQDPPWKPRKLVPHENEAIHSMQFSVPSMKFVPTKIKPSTV